MIAGTGVLPNTAVPGVPAASNTLSNPVVAIVSGQATDAFDEILKATPPALLAFLTNLPAVEGNILNFLSFLVHDIVVIVFLVITNLNS